jgi:hypothetical protein
MPGHAFETKNLNIIHLEKPQTDKEPADRSPAHGQSPSGLQAASPPALYVGSHFQRITTFTRDSQSDREQEAFQI